MKKKLTTVLAALVLFSAGALQAQQAADAEVDGSWIHIRVQEDGQEKVNVNLPLRLVGAALEANSGKAGGLAADLHLDEEDDISVEQLRRMWQEVRDTGDAEFVNVRDDDARIRVYREGERVHVKVDEDGKKKVRVELPAAIVDALLRGEGDRLDLSAAARELAKLDQGQIVQIDDEGSQVRIWVDRQSGAVGS